MIVSVPQTTLPSICLFIVCLSVYLYIYLPACLPIWLAVCLSIYLSICLFVCRSIYLPIYLYIYIYVLQPLIVSVPETTLPTFLTCLVSFFCVPVFAT